MLHAISPARRHSRTHRRGQSKCGYPLGRANLADSSALGGISGPRPTGSSGWHTRPRHPAHAVAPALKRFVREQNLPGVRSRPTTNWSSTRGATAAPRCHASCTCMMWSHAIAVVDAELEAHGLDRPRYRRVGDANADAPPIMIAERARQRGKEWPCSDSGLHMTRGMVGFTRLVLTVPPRLRRVCRSALRLRYSFLFNLTLYAGTNQGAQRQFDKIDRGLCLEAAAGEPGKEPSTARMIRAAVIFIVIAPAALAKVNSPDDSASSPNPTCSISGSRNGNAPSPIRNRKAADRNGGIGRDPKQRQVDDRMGDTPDMADIEHGAGGADGQQRRYDDVRQGAAPDILEAEGQGREPDPRHRFRPTPLSPWRRPRFADSDRQRRLRPAKPTASNTRSLCQSHPGQPKPALRWSLDRRPLRDRQIRCSSGSKFPIDRQRHPCELLAVSSLEAFRTPASVHALAPVPDGHPKTLNDAGHSRRRLDARPGRGCRRQRKPFPRPEIASRCCL
jgi:hypothetical protein